MICKLNGDNVDLWIIFPSFLLTVILNVELYKCFITPVEKKTGFGIAFVTFIQPLLNSYEANRFFGKLFSVSISLGKDQFSLK